MASQGPQEYIVPSIFDTAGRVIDVGVQGVGVVFGVIPAALLGYFEGANRSDVSGLQGVGESLRELVVNANARRGAGLIGLGLAYAETQLHLIPRFISAVNSAMMAFKAGK